MHVYAMLYYIGMLDVIDTLMHTVSSATVTSGIYFDIRCEITINSKRQLSILKDNYQFWKITINSER